MDGKSAYLIATIGFATLSISISANAQPMPVETFSIGNWTVETFIDGLTDHKFQMASANDIKTLLDGNSVRLRVHCLGNIGIQNQAEPMFLIQLQFSKTVSLRDSLNVRFRFDDGPAYQMKAENLVPKEKGLLYALFDGRNMESQLNFTLVRQLKAASRLRISLDDFPAASGTLLDFNVVGAGGAIDALPCKK